MKESIKKLTLEIAENMKSVFASSDFQNEVKQIKEASDEDSGTFRMVISTDDVDRHGEIVVQEGISLERYLENPVVLWGHDSYSHPVGITQKLFLESDGTRRKTIAEGKFAPTEEGQILRKLYDAKILNTSSIGFIPTEYEGNKITKCELLEWSFVCIPANPFAQAVRTLGFKVSDLIAKGIMELQKGEEIKTNEDGTEDVIAKDEEAGEGDDGAEQEPNAEDLEEIEGEAEEGTVNDTDKTFVMTMVGGKKIKFILTEEFANDLKEKFAGEEKAGRVLSKANLEKVKTAISALEEVVKIAEAPSEEDDSKANDISEGKNDKEAQEAQDFLTLRRGLQGIATSISKILEDAKLSAKERGIKTR